MMFAALGFFFNMVIVFTLYLDNLYVAKIIFVYCCTSVLISIIFFIVEIHISTRALNLRMSDMNFKRQIFWCGQRDLNSHRLGPHGPQPCLSTNSSMTANHNFDIVIDTNVTIIQ